MGIFLISFGFSLKKERRNRRLQGLANCLQMGVPQQANVSSYDVLRFINRHHYLIVPKSNPPTSRKTRNVGTSAKWSTPRCPFTFNVIDYAETVPRFLTAARCPGCNFHCKPVMYTHYVLIRKCKNYWMWTRKTLPVAFVWVD